MELNLEYFLALVICFFKDNLKHQALKNPEQNACYNITEDGLADAESHLSRYLFFKHETKVHCELTDFLQLPWKVPVPSN
jgi:hypothetical protein